MKKEKINKAEKKYEIINYLIEEYDEFFEKENLRFIKKYFKKFYIKNTKLIFSILK